MRYGRLAMLFVLGLAMASASRALAQGVGVARGIEYLRSSRPDRAGEAALAALAAVKAGVPPTDPGIAPLIAVVMRRFESSGLYSPQLSGGPDIYEAGVTAMLLSAMGSTEYKPQLQAVASFLASRQNENGSWDYTSRSAGDTSISQYAMLGLWEAEMNGVRIAPTVWERAARWLISTQSPDGGWNYHRDEAARYPNTLSMTAAGTGSLLICQRQLASYRRVRDPAEKTSPLLKDLVPTDAPVEYRVGLSDAQMNDSIQRGVQWIGRNFNPANSQVVGPTPFYGLYGVERVGALIGQAQIAGIDWYSAGSSFISGRQAGNGSWDSQHGPIVNTAWAILFLSKATEKSVARSTAKRLGSGTLLGGRGLPADLSNMTVAQGRVIVRPMGGAIEEMLAVLEDPRATSADSALAGLVDRYTREGPRALAPLKDRLKKMLESRDTGIRMTAIWALARTGDLDVAPDLIACLTDPDDDVVSTAAFGLKLLSRKLQGYGPEPGATPEQKAEAAERWRQWLESLGPSVAAEGPATSLTGPGR